MDPLVHGGLRYRDPVVIDAGVIEALEDMARACPVHNLPSLTGIRAGADASATGPSSCPATSAAAPAWQRS